MLRDDEGRKNMGRIGEKTESFNDSFKKKIDELYAEKKVGQKYLFGAELDEDEYEVVSQIEKREYMIACLDGLKKEIDRMIKRVKYEQEVLALSMKDGKRGMDVISVEIKAIREVSIERKKKKKIKKDANNIIESRCEMILCDMNEKLKEEFLIKNIEEKIEQEEKENEKNNE